MVIAFRARSFAFLCLLAAALACASCNKPKPPAPNLEIRAVTRELVFAARIATGGRAEVGMRPEYAPREAGRPQTLVADQIFITVPLTKAGAPDQAAHQAIESELAKVSEYHHLLRVSRPAAPGTERFDYVVNGHRTQSVHIITPLARVAQAQTAARKPELAIVIDDLGNDQAQADAIFRFPYPLTLSVLPDLPKSGEIAEEAHRRGYQVLLHLPMAAVDGNKDESIELQPGMDSNAVGRIFAAMLDTVPYAAGVNNHEGSRGTADPALMSELMPLLRERKLFFIDSRTTAATVAETAAHTAGVPAASRNVFLDDDVSPEAIRQQLLLAVRDARENGAALAIGHPHRETLQVLAEQLPEMDRQGVQLVFASDLVR